MQINFLYPSCLIDGVQALGLCWKVLIWSFFQMCVRMKMQVSHVNRELKCDCTVCGFSYFRYRSDGCGHRILGARGIIAWDVWMLLTQTGYSRWPADSLCGMQATESSNCFVRIINRDSEIRPKNCFQNNSWCIWIYPAFQFVYTLPASLFMFMWSWSVFESFGCFHFESVPF
jgi:hypothetical protein